MDISVFTDKGRIPDEEELKDVLGESYPLWVTLSEDVHLKYPKAVDQWSYPGAKYGWNFRIKDKKRAIVYLLPREKYFKIAFVFGEKATQAVMQSSVSSTIKSELASARAYAEGRGIRIDVMDDSNLHDIKELIDIKIAH